MSDKFFYFQSCVDFTPFDAKLRGGLCDMIDSAISITRATFLRHVHKQNLQSIEKMLSYSKHPKQGLTMAGDYHVTYHRGKLYGHTVYFFKQSGIEHVFTKAC